MSEISLNPLALLALGLLAERPMHPYEMFQLATQRRDHRLVKIRPGTLYHAVTRLEKDSLIAVHSVEREGNRPERTTYAITHDGRSALRGDLARLLAEPAAEYPVFPFALGEAHNLDVEQVTRLLTERIAALHATIGELEDGLASVRAKQLPWAYWLHLEYLREQHASQVRWLESALADIAAGRFATSTATRTTTTNQNESNA